MSSHTRLQAVEQRLSHIVSRALSLAARVSAWVWDQPDHPVGGGR